MGTSAESSPFSLAREPEGYRLVQAGPGGLSQTWSSDSSGDDEPVTVLAPPGADPDGPEVVRVSLTGFEGFQGGLDQAAAGYPLGGGEHFELDGREAIYTPGHDEDGRRVRADLVVVARDDLAIRVAAYEATRDELTEVAREVEPTDDHLLAPRVSHPPGDLGVIGWADADVGVTLVNAPFPGGEASPAGIRAHSAAWAVGAPGTPWSADAGTVAVSTLPGTALDLDALADSLHTFDNRAEPQVVAREVDGRPGAVLERPGGDESPPFRAVATSAPSGDLLLVVAHGASQPSVDELVAVAASVESATREEWDAFVERAGDGPGLHPDEGAVELTRGTASDVEWLFQARVDDGSFLNWGATSLDQPSGDYLADPCLKLGTGERSCPTSTSATGGDSVVTGMAGPMTLEDGRTFPGFVVVMTTLPAATMRTHREDNEATDPAPLLPIPGGQRRAAVVVTSDGLGLLPACTSTGSQSIVELLDESGQPLPC
ncbi:MAG TPA: hypothetical protein VK360_08280 [Acidimicrobiales bacterium]|nr:hypothetical protein [Acidimicrobiales bacterium]